MWNLPLLPSQTDAQTKLSVSGAVVYNRRAIIHGMFQASVVNVWFHRCRYIFMCWRSSPQSLQSLLAFNSALDVRWILRIWVFRSKGKYSPDGKKVGGPEANRAPLLLLKCCWGRGQMRRVFLIIQHGWYFKQEGACVPCARHESAQLVRGHE